jgi:Fe-S cluster assembly protein SufD
MGRLSLKPLNLPAIAGDGPLFDLRRAAAARFLELGAPVQRLERWKYTSLTPLAKAEFALAGAAGVAELPRIDGTARLVFTNGRFDAARSDALPEGVTTLGALGEADVLSLLGPVADAPDQSLTVLNTAFSTDGYVLELGEGVALDQPLHIVHVAGAGAVANLRNIVRLGAKARATIVESWLGEGEYWANPVTDIRLANGAVLTHYKWQREADAAFHTALNSVSIAANARYDALTLATGGRIMRHEFSIMLDGEGADCRLSGAALGAKAQHLDFTVTMDHRSPHAQSGQAFKSVLASGARSVFQGLVKVGRGAIGTDAHQTSNNLLLDRSAEADAKPELEIFADDVACSHGATVGELDEAKVFYLKSRGLSDEAARALLVEGFVAELFDGAADEAIAAHLREGAQAAARRLTGKEAV